MTKQELASKIDHTLLKPEALPQDVDRVCEEAIRYGFASVCVNPAYVSRCASKLAGTGVKVCTVVGFPLGSNTTLTKMCETRDAIAAGATEIDMVIHVGALKAGLYDDVRSDIRAVVNAASDRAIVKVIIETCFLNDEEKKIAARLTEEAGAHFVKTSTGFGLGGATVEDIRLLKEIVGDRLGVKASGGIRTLKFATELLQAGATRLGMSSSVAVVEEIS